MGQGTRKLHTFGVSNGTFCCNFSGEFRVVVVSAVTGTQSVWAPGVEVALRVVRMVVSDKYPSLPPTLYLGVLATEPRPFGTLDAMWLAFQNLAHNMTPSITGENFCSLVASSTGVRCLVLKLCQKIRLYGNL